MSAQVLGCPLVSIVTFWEVAELDFRPIPKVYLILSSFLGRKRELGEGAILLRPAAKE